MKNPKYLLIKKSGKDWALEYVTFTSKKTATKTKNLYRKMYDTVYEMYKLEVEK